MGVIFNSSLHVKIIVIIFCGQGIQHQPEWKNSKLLNCFIKKINFPIQKYIFFFFWIFWWRKMMHKYNLLLFYIHDACDAEVYAWCNDMECLPIMSMFVVIYVAYVQFVTNNHVLHSMYSLQFVFYCMNVYMHASKDGWSKDIL